jgi:hypothetical protein
MKEFLLELPQNIIGFFIYLIYRKKIERDTIINLLNKHRSYFIDKQIQKYKDEYLNKKICLVNVGKFTGVSLGNYVFVNTLYLYDVLHEMGHQKQSKEYKWLYLLRIGFPSFVFNIYNRLFHKKWEIYKRKNWYYNLPWEKDANDRSGIKFANNTWVYIER